MSIRRSIHRLRAGSALFVALAAAITGCDAGDARPDASAAASDAAPAAAAGAVAAIDDAGRTVRLDAPARRIVSLLPATTETLVALGASDRLVARTDFDDAALDHLPSVGGGLTPSLEILAALEPDLVIAWEEAGTARIRPRLEAMGIPVFAVTTRDTAGIFANVDRLGRLLGEPERADSLATEMRDALAAVRRSVEDRSSPATLYMIGLDPPMVAGPNVFIGEVLSIAGGRNVFNDVTAPSPQVSMEEIVRRRPEVVLLPASGPSSAPVERLRSVPGWRELIESGDVRFHTLPTDLLHRPGPSIVEAARVLRDLLHPDAAPFE